MNIAGYLVMMSNLQALSAAQGGQTKDMSVRVGPLHQLADELARFPEFSTDCFRTNGFCKVGNVGKYISANLNKYMAERNGDPKDQGLILTLYFADPSELEMNDEPNGFQPLLPPSQQYTQYEYSPDQQQYQQKQQYAPYQRSVYGQ